MRNLFLSALLLCAATGFAQTRTYDDPRYNDNGYRGGNRGTRNGATQSNVLFPGTIYPVTDLVVGRHYSSANGTYYFTFQSDGNLCVYRTGNNQNTWSSGTANRNVTKCELQADGNLVLTDNSGRVVWAAYSDKGARSVSKSGRSALEIQDDGSLVIYGVQLNPVKWSATP